MTERAPIDSFFSALFLTGFLRNRIRTLVQLFHRKATMDTAAASWQTRAVAYSQAGMPGGRCPGRHGLFGR